MLTRLVEVLLIEALRSSDGDEALPGLDERLAPTLRRMHAEMAQPWTMAELAKVAVLSRSAFFERFSRQVGLAPMEYLLAWRMAVAKASSGARISPSAKSPNGSATAPPAPSAPPSAAR